MERLHRAVALCERHRARPTTRRRWLLRACRGARSRGCRVAGLWIRTDQEPASGSIELTGRVDGQPRCAGLCPLWAARRGRSPHREYHQSDRCHAQGGDASRSGLASLSGRRLRGTRGWRTVRWNGHGRGWPLLTGERGHYELAAGRPAIAEGLARTMEALAGESGLLPEQVWDTADIPGRELLIGHASGSASPLVWAHAEYLKLCRSIREGKVFDRPPQTVERYIVNRAPAHHLTWRFNNKVRTMPAGRILR